jgi:hypothetical protein
LFAQNLRIIRKNELLQPGEFRPKAVHSFIGDLRDTYYKKIGPPLAGLGDGCDEWVSPQAPPVGEELDPKTSELTESASSFYHSSTNAQLFELLENLKAELLKRSNDG